MFLGMPGLNGDSYSASQVWSPTSFSLVVCTDDGVGGRYTCHSLHALSQGGLVTSVIS